MRLRAGCIIIGLWTCTGRCRKRTPRCPRCVGTDVCFAPVLSISEAPHHPHNIARKTFTEVNGVVQPSPAPKFSRTKSKIQSSPSSVGEDTRSCLVDWGFEVSDVDDLFAKGVVK